MSLKDILLLFILRMCFHRRLFEKLITKRLQNEREITFLTYQVLKLVRIIISSPKNLLIYTILSQIIRNPILN